MNFGRALAMLTLAALVASTASHASSPSLSRAALPSAMEAELDRMSRDYIADRCHVGLSIVVRAGGRTYFRDYGSVGRDRIRRPTPDSAYELASVTKTFIGALSAKALLDGRMTLDGDFRSYLPGAYPNLAMDGAPITLRTLATHTSGLQRDLPDSDALMARHDDDHIGDELAVLDKGYDRARSLAALRSVTLRTAPGSSFAYSNLGIRVIGYGLEQVYRASLSNLLRTSILRPLKMSQTTFTPTAAMRARLVTPYSRLGHVQPFHDDSAGAAYGLYSTPRDMARYLAWQLDTRNSVAVRSHALIRASDADGQGLIWNIRRDGSEPMLWHGGGSFGETSQIVLYPGKRLGFVLLANDACDGSETALKKIATAVAAK